MITRIRIKVVPPMYLFLTVGQEFEVIAHERVTRSGKPMWVVNHYGRQVRLLRREFDIVETSNEGDE